MKHYHEFWTLKNVMTQGYRYVCDLSKIIRIEFTDHSNRKRIYKATIENIHSKILSSNFLTHVFWIKTRLKTLFQPQRRREKLHSFDRTLAPDRPRQTLTDLDRP